MQIRANERAMSEKRDLRNLSSGNIRFLCIHSSFLFFSFCTVYVFHSSEKESVYVCYVSMFVYSNHFSFCYIYIYYIVSVLIHLLSTFRKKNYEYDLTFLIQKSLLFVCLVSILFLN